MMAQLNGQASTSTSTYAQTGTGFAFFVAKDAIKSNTAKEKMTLELHFACKPQKDKKDENLISMIASHIS